VRRWRGVESTPSGWGRSVVTIGVFDGVHLGHQQIIGHTVRRARELGVPSVVVTFDPHPAEVVRPGSHPAVLTTTRRKAELVEELGVDVLCVLPFTRELSRCTPEGFVHAVLVERLHAAAVVVGENFRFGHRAAGDVATLARLGARWGFAVEGAPLLSGPADSAGPRSGPSSATVFSSTYIRACVDAGSVEDAARALGRPHRVEGVVVRGDRRGRTLGFPTANLQTHPYAAVPADGVYAGRLVHSGEEPAAAVSIGSNPTFSGRERRVEAYVLDFEGDLYGEHVGLDFLARLRPTLAFDAVEDLVEQMEDDVRRTREITSAS